MRPGRGASRSATTCALPSLRDGCAFCESPVVALVKLAPPPRRRRGIVAEGGWASRLPAFGPPGRRQARPTLRRPAEIVENMFVVRWNYHLQPHRRVTPLLTL